MAEPEKIEPIRIGPQPGPQTDFLASKADIAIYGGGAGGGKSYALLLEPTRHVNNSDFGGVIFRKTSPEIRNEGGLWDESAKLYPLIGAEPKSSTLEWIFPSTMKMRFAHMEHEKTKYKWQGSQLPFIGWDELTHFSESQFFYMLSRNRSSSGVPGYVRATCNPDADSWVAKLIMWWIDQNTGQPIKERSGKLRWFIRSGDKLVWGDSREEMLARFGDDCEPKSLTFIPASVYDNKILLQNDPAYLANLKALPRVDRERLLNQNWKIRPAAGLYFKASYFKVVDTLPANRITVRFWDLASTEKTDVNDPSWTVGCKLSIDSLDNLYVEHIERDQRSPGGVEEMVKNTASQDGKRVQIGMWQDPGQAGKAQVTYYSKQLKGYTLRGVPAAESKLEYANPVSAQAEIGNVYLLRGPWNKDFIEELENFPEGKKNDQVDAFSGGYQYLTGKPVGEVTEDMEKESQVMTDDQVRGGNW